MLYVVAIAILFTTVYSNNSGVGIQTTATASIACTDSCDPSDTTGTTCSNSGSSPGTTQVCARDAERSSDTRYCFICQDSDPCSNYPDYCEDKDYCINQYGYSDKYRCSSNVMTAGTSTYVCNYCKCDEYSGYCSTNDDCGTGEKCVGAGTASSANVATCGMCESTTTTPSPTTPSPTTPSPTTPSPTTEEPTSTTQCDPTWGVVSTATSNGTPGTSYCALTLCDGTEIPEDQISIDNKADMRIACPDLAVCPFDKWTFLDSCGCPRWYVT